MTRVRKALVAGVGSGVGAAVVYLQANSFSLTGEIITGAVAAFLAAGIPVGYATWQTKNATRQTG
jgi:hypothetical protein